MEFLKECIVLQHREILNQVSQRLFTDEDSKEHFKNTYDKRNYCMIKASSCKLQEPRVKIDDLLSSLQCDHNPSFSR